MFIGFPMMSWQSLDGWGFGYPISVCKVLIDTGESSPLRLCGERRSIWLGPFVVIDLSEVYDDARILACAAWHII